MNTLKDLNLKISYRHDRDNMIDDFYNPVLATAKTYQRAVGYFTISSLINMAQGLSELIKNGGKVFIVTSPKLDENDISVIESGIKMKEDVYLDVMIRELSDINSKSYKKQLNYIATLIADDRLEIKIAVRSNHGAFHEKFGIIEDQVGNKISFIGSMNETYRGQVDNFESIAIFKSWGAQDHQEMVKEHEANFENLWSNKTNGLAVIDFPKALKEKILEYKSSSDYNKNFVENDETVKKTISISDEIIAPSWFNPYDYQELAVQKWFENNNKGMFVMATGTGKTLTALHGIKKLYEKTKTIAVIIVCPQKQLVEQWSKEVQQFNISPILCNSSYGDWKKQLVQNIQFINKGLISNLVMITTTDMFVKKQTQDMIRKINTNKLLMIDEAHNAGANNMKSTLLENDVYDYKLALTATPKRHFDDESTDFIYKYFEKEVYRLDLDEAIEKGFLTRYFYYPHSVHLTQEEYDEYMKLTIQIIKMQSAKDKDSKKTIKEDPAVTMKKIQRARIVAGASNKINVLKNLMQKEQATKHILVYCGSAQDTEIDIQGLDRVNQLNHVCKVLGIDMGYGVRKFTAEENDDERREILESFKEGKDNAQILVAIKCLDEGVNIPAIQHAYILASTTNPKEYIQRRGRVLRKSPETGKKYAYIHDFVVLPPLNIDDNEVSATSKNLVGKELVRVEEFAKLSENINDNVQYMNMLVEKYKITEEENE